MDDIVARYEKGRVILFRKTDPVLLPVLEKIDAINRRAAVLWAFEVIKEPAAYLLGRYSNRWPINEAVETCRSWSQGIVKMSEARRCILGLHSFAGKLEDRADRALVRAVAQALSTIHVKDHAIGFCIYELTSIIFQEGLDKGLSLVPERISYYLDKLEWAEKTEKEGMFNWAPFLLNG